MYLPGKPCNASPLPFKLLFNEISYMWFVLFHKKGVNCSLEYLSIWRYRQTPVTHKYETIHATREHIAFVFCVTLKFWRFLRLENKSVKFNMLIQIFLFLVFFTIILLQIYWIFGRMWNKYYEAVLLKKKIKVYIRVFFYHSAPKASLMCRNILDYVCSHLQRRLMNFLRIVVNLRIFPAIA